MINLLPNEKKNENQKEYYGRLSVVVLSALLILLVGANLLLLPSFVLSKVKLSITEEQLQELKKSDTGKRREELRDLAEGVNDQIEFLALSSKAHSVQMVVREILNKRGSISINLLTYKRNVSEDGDSDDEEDSTPEANIQIKAIAPDRKALIGFRNRLEEGDTFQKVELPVSSLEAEKDIRFTMQLSVQRPENES